MKKNKCDIYNIYKLDAIESTQNYLLDMDLELMPQWSVIIASNQTKGKGQEGAFWESEKGKNLTFSFLLKPYFIDVSNQFLITQVLSLGIYDFLSGYLGEVKIKWPNDIYIGRNKICGILVNNKIIGDKISCSICGIGININQEKFSFAPNPSSLKLETNREYDLDDVLLRLLDAIKKRYETLMGIGNYKEEYLHHLMNYSIWARYIYNDVEIEAKIIDVNEYGHLVLTTKEGKTLVVELKNIRFCL